MSKIYHCKTCGKECKYSFQKKNIFCSIQCQRDGNYKEYIEQWLSGEIKGGQSSTYKVSGYVRRYIYEKQNHKCAKCGIGEWNGERIVLEIDHISGNNTDHSESNLQALCPNCHSQTPTYKGRNIKKCPYSLTVERRSYTP